MARIRSVKPEFWHDELIGTLGRDARLLYMGMWNLADEHSRLRAEPRYLKAQVFPYDDDLTVDAVQRMLCELQRAGRVRLYEVDGQRYGLLPTLAKNQRLDLKVDSKLPEPPTPAAAPMQADAPVQINPDESAPSGADESASSFLSTVVVDGSVVDGVTRELALVDAPPDRPPRNLTEGQRVVEAYVQGAVGAGLTEPDRTLRGRVGKQATAMLGRYPLDVLLLAARHMGEAGWHDLSVQIQRDAKAQQQSRGSPRAPAHVEHGDRILRDAMARANARGEFA